MVSIAKVYGSSLWPTVFRTDNPGMDDKDARHHLYLARKRGFSVDTVANTINGAAATSTGVSHGQTHTLQLQMHPETDLMARRRMMVGGQERIGAVTDWKKLALEHQAEIGRLNLEASENERLWDALFQKVLITSHQLELDNQVLRAGFLGEPSAIEACKIIIATKHSAPEGKEAIIRRQREELQRLKIELSKRSKGEGVDVGYSSFSSTMAQDYDLMACAKLLDLWMDYDPEGLEDMQKIYLEIEKRPHPMDEQRISRLLVKDLQTDEGEDWQDKKKRMSERIKALFDDSVSLEKRRKRLRFERAAAVMWGMNPATNRKERALMESLWELDKERKNNNGTPLPSTLVHFRVSEQIFVVTIHQYRMLKMSKRTSCSLACWKVMLAWPCSPLRSKL